MRRILRSRRLWTVVAGGAVAGALALGALAALGEARTEAAPACICPDVYAPVICSNGKIYPNLCVANCKHAKNCEPLILWPPPL